MKADKWMTGGSWLTESHPYDPWRLFFLVQCEGGWPAIGVFDSDMWKEIGHSLGIPASPEHRLPERLFVAYRVWVA